MSEIGRVLLAEDSAPDVELTLSAFEEHHLANQVVVVRDGAEAWDYLSRRGAYEHRAPGAPAIVLLDVNMPKMGGLEVLRRMRADAELRFVPVVMLTGSREERDIVESYRLGANAYIMKPVSFEELIGAAKSLGLYWAMLKEPPGAGSREAA